MSKMFKIDVDVDSVISYVAEMKAGSLKDYDESPWLLRADASRFNEDKNLFRYIEVQIGLPTYSIRRIKVITVYDSTMVYGMPMDRIGPLQTMSGVYSEGPRAFLEECKDMIFVINLVHTPVHHLASDVIELTDGMVGMIAQNDSMPYNKIGQDLVSKFVNKLSPDKLLEMEGLRKEFSEFVRKKTGKDLPSASLLKEWLEKKGISHKHFTEVESGLEVTSAFGRYDILLLAEGDYKEWIKSQTVKGATSFVVKGLLATTDLVEGTAIYEMEAVALDVTVSELIGYLAALILV